MNAELLCIGDELLIGQVVNTNASWLGEKLHSIGIRIRRVTTIGDDVNVMLDAFKRAWDEQDILICTGGLGPTHDDRTREAVLRFFHTSLVQDPQVLEDIERFFSKRNRALTDTNRDQAMVPAGAIIIRNPEGTAPGYHFTESGKHCFVTPGVPYEMKSMLENYVLPLLSGLNPSRHASLTLLTTGIPESTLADALPGIDTMLPETSVAFLPSPLGVRIRLTCYAVDENVAADALSSLKEYVLLHAGEYVYGANDDALEAVVGELLVGRHLTLAVAESCTGGLIADRITNTPGSSRWFERGAVVYSNESKTAMLGVDPLLIQRHGAVSREVCEAMAEGIRRASGTALGLATTGVAGPAGGSAEKPVGLVWIGLSAENGTWSHAFHFGDDRIRTKQRAAQSALDVVRRYLLSLPIVPIN